MLKGLLRWFSVAGVIAGGVAIAAAFAVGDAGPVSTDGDTPVMLGGTQPLSLVENEEYRYIADQAFISRRLAGDDPARSPAGRRVPRRGRQGREEASQGARFRAGPADVHRRVERRSARIRSSSQLRTSGALGNMSGRIGALAIRPSNGQFILGAAQGGIWLFNSATGTWSAKTTDQTTQAIGALAIAPSNDAIIYAGTGEGAFSGDSYFGNGVLKSTDGGNTWTHVSDDYFRGVATQPDRRRSDERGSRVRSRSFAAVAAPAARPRTSTPSAACGSRRTAASTGS